MKPAAEGIVIWLTGIPASGKTTIAERVVRTLRDRGSCVLWLDSDDLREVLTPRASYTPADRDHFYTALAHLAFLGARGGSTVVVSATAPEREHRNRARRRVARFLEVLVDCDLATASARDPKGLYARARRGELQNLPGLGTAYEPPEHPELVVDPVELGAEGAAAAVVRLHDLAVPKR